MDLGVLCVLGLLGLLAGDARGCWELLGVAGGCWRLLGVAGGCWG